MPLQSTRYAGYNIKRKKLEDIVLLLPYGGKKCKLFKTEGTEGDRVC